MSETNFSGCVEDQTWRRIFLHTLLCFETIKQLPMYLYIGGDAGVGKSTVIRALL